MHIAQEHELLATVVTGLPAVGSVLVFAPHPDDEIFGCGGTLCLLQKTAARVTVHILTDGALGGDNADGRLSEIRAEESTRALRLLGISKPVLWGMPDRGLSYGEHLIVRLSETILADDAELVFLPSPAELHPDHQVLALAGAEALRRLGGQRRAVFYEVGAPLPSPTLLIDISAVAEDKRLAMHCFSSQLSEQPYADRIVGLNMFRGHMMGAQVTSAEAFLAIPVQQLTGDLGRLFDGPVAHRHRQGYAAVPTDLPLVSIIIRSMDRPTLTDALASLSLQTYPNLEVLVVNAHGGQHRTLDQQCGRFPLRLLNQGGQHHTRPSAANLGMAAARGIYIGFLDDDDIVTPDHLSCLVNALQDATGEVVVYSGVQGLNRNDSKGVIISTFAEPEVSFAKLLLGNVIPIHAVLFPATLLKQGAAFDESLDCYEDWDFWLQLSRQVPFIFVDRITATYHLGGDSEVAPLAPDAEAVRQSAHKLFAKWLPLLFPAEMKAVADLYHQTNYDLSSKLRYAEKQLQEAEEGLKKRQEELWQEQNLLQHTQRQLQYAETDLNASETQRAEVERQLSHVGKALENLEQRSAELERQLQEAEELRQKGQEELWQEQNLLQHTQRQLQYAETDLKASETQRAEVEQQLSHAGKALENLEQRSAELERQLQETERQLQETERQFSHVGKALGNLEQRSAELERELEHLRADNDMQQQELTAVYASRSWRLTGSVRWCGRAVRKIRADLLEGLRWTYRRLPLSLDQRAAVRAWYYSQPRTGLPELLQECAPPHHPGAVALPVSPFTQAALSDAPIRILLIERSVPRPNQDAGSMMIYSFIRVFREQGHAVTFFPADLVYDPDYTPALQALGVTCLHVPVVHSLYEHLVVSGASYDIILACRPDHTDAVLPLLRTHCPRARLLYETHDLHYVRQERQAALEQRQELREELLVHARWRKAQELRIAAAVDCTIVVSEQERQTLLQENPELHVEVIPVVAESFGCKVGYRERQDLIFIGGYEHQPNVDAVLYFAREIMPLIVAQCPDIRFHVVGSHPPPEVAALADTNVVVHGFVPDLTDLMNQVRISVNALRFGAGVKGKLVTSMSYGVPCIGTSIAFEGMGVVPEQQALVADAPQDFASAVLRLYHDQALWEQLSAAGMELAHQHFSLGAASRGFTRIFTNLLGTFPRNGLQLERIISREAWQQVDRSIEQQRRQGLEAALTIGGEPFITHGFCFVCGREVNFHSDLVYGFPQPGGAAHPNWRERIICPDCKLNNRMRAAIHLFHLLCAPTPESRLYLTEQTTSFFDWFRQHYDHVTGSEYLAESVPPGATNGNGIRNESLTALSFSDNQFDAILSFDVIEHIPDYLQAFRECLRCLKPDGTLFFTVPFAHQSLQHIVRAELDQEGQIHHLLPPEYHGDPINADGCLCFYHFGWELLDQLRALGFRDVAVYSYWSQRFGYLGGDQILFKAIK